jgi:hypothetical protein
VVTIPDGPPVALAPHSRCEVGYPFSGVALAEEMTMALKKKGAKAPDFKLPSDAGDEVRLKDLRGKKVVLFFYPKDATPG